MKSPWVSDWVIWVAMECSRHDLCIFLWTSTTWSRFCDPQMIKLWRFTFPDKWKVASSLKTILSKNKLYSLRQFSILVQKFLQCCQSLGFNSCSSWNLYGQKTISYVAPSTLSCERHHPVPFLTTVPEPNILRKMDRLWRRHSMVTQINQYVTHGLFILRIRDR
jgi:hypothetical protein